MCHDVPLHFSPAAYPRYWQSSPPSRPDQPGVWYQVIYPVIYGKLPIEMDWFKGKFTGKLHIYWENRWFLVDFPLNQSIDHRNS